MAVMTGFTTDGLQFRQTRRAIDVRNDYAIEWVNVVQRLGQSSLVL
jgi:hypothetical protein